MFRRSSRFSLCSTLFGLLALAALTPAGAQTITGLSIPVDSMDSGCRPRDEGVWSVSPLNINSGIGYLVNPTIDGSFVLHDHQYASANVPDPARAIVTYTFDQPTIVSQLDIVQHTNGVTLLEGFYGDSLGSMTSLGSVFGPSGDVTGSGLLPEGGHQIFDFGNTTNAGTIFQFVVRKTSLSNGWALYRAFPTLSLPNPNVVPEPGALALALGLTVPGAALLLRRRRLPKA